jgi:hypothetical protein
MSIVVRFPTSNMTKQQYQTVHDALQSSGSWPTPGLLLHVCFGDERNLRVSEIWESREQLKHSAKSYGRNSKQLGSRCRVSLRCSRSRTWRRFRSRDAGRRG